ncbi:MAG: hypothetical protein WAN05_32290 [Roseiarcus sp.]
MSEPMIDPDLKSPRRTVRRGPKTVHDWSLPAAPVAERAIAKLEDQLEYARDELVTDFHRAASRLGCSHYFDAPDDPLSAIFTVYDEKIDRAVSALKRALR